MLAVRPVIRVTAKVIVAMAGTMILPAWLDWQARHPDWLAFALTAGLGALAGGLVAAATDGPAEPLTVEQAFLLTSLLWLVAPLFGAVPLMVGETQTGFLDALFEAMSGMTTTGTTIYPDLDLLSPGANMWRAMLQWEGGLGIVVVAMLFLPVMRVGGMQFFRSEGFDMRSKDLPSAAGLARQLTAVYVAMTVACALLYRVSGMSGYDAVLHAFATCSTGGFSNHDASFAVFGAGAQYTACLFMVLAALPFIRLVHLMHGDPMPLWRDPQARAFLRWIAYATAAIILYRGVTTALPVGAPLVTETMARETLFNTISIFTGTGFALGDVSGWGPFVLAVLFLCGLIGGCTGSTVCSIKVFRYLVLAEAIRVQLRRMAAPHRILPLRYEGRRLDQDVLDSVMSFMALFILTFGLLIVGLGLTGLAPRTALTAAWTSIANIGPVFGPGVSGTGAVDQFPASARWLMIAGMYLGRLELVSVLVLLLPRFWRSQTA
ncbi:potassium transporter TrkH [Paracoccus sp. S-4012]|uniref:TrkH family potassium uptake protein n=1 Tax=Paracoccus sp. S-4012 TaxID=2665648 RepID=UPI0012B082D0|nr:TrkH family potassium uptake protein [Paracoccus sp. S-4012]MRX50637.1 potassium transporter TrkH [Paracoccus sp. S-4012]